MELVTTLLITLLGGLFFLGTMLERMEQKQEVIRIVLFELVDMTNRPDAYAKLTPKHMLAGYTIGYWIWYGLWGAFTFCGIIYAFLLR